MHKNKTKIEQRNLGAYYTPRSVSDVISTWAIRTPNDTILEPSFGGCGFIDSIKQVLKDKGQKHAEKKIWGCDIDADAFNYLASSLGPVSIGYHQRFLHNDFLKTNKNSFSKTKFDAVIGNPPYLGHHNLSQDQKEIGKLIMNEWGLIDNNTPRANLWFYFVLHSFRFLKPGGRVSFVLPANFTKTKFAEPLHELINKSFKTKTVIYLKDQLFKGQGAKERVCVLFADGWSTSDSYVSKMIYLNSNSINEFKKHVEQKSITRRNNQDIRERLSIKTDLVDSSNLKILNSVSNYSNCHTLRKYIDIRIGLVTGDSKYFVLNKTTAKKHSLSTEIHLEPIVNSMIDIDGISFNKKNITNNINNDKKCLLLKSTKNSFKSINYRNYINSYPTDKIENNKTFQKRPEWFSINDNLIPDAFMTYMAVDGPRIVINNAKVNCTNNVHRIYFKDNLDTPTRKLIAISLLTSYSQISAELISRYYGSGALKIEPSEAKRIEVIIPSSFDKKELNKVFFNINKELTNNNSSKARSLADEYIFNCCFSHKDSAYYLEKLTVLLQKLRAFRKGLE